MLILRPVAAEDLDDLLELAAQLDSMNLPRDRDFLAERIARSQQSFAAAAGHGSLDWRQCVYVFVLEDLAAKRCVGTSLILAKNGRPEAPYYWLEVSSEERWSPELAKRFVHKKLCLRSTVDGPTEVGGLILDPAYRAHPLECGKALSIVRFAFISAHPGRFERQLIAEMLSPFDAPGKNRLWDAFGAKFTGLPYREADHLSARTKQFIADLFPEDPVYVTLFPEEVQKVIGEPAETAKAAVRILERIGFSPMNQVDPFDGGPYYGAARDAVVSVRERRELVLPGTPAAGAPGEAGPLALLSTEAGGRFRASVVSLDASGAPLVCAAHREVLRVKSGDRVSVTPLPARTSVDPRGGR
jgi:arginine N-succinyltransferase